MQNQLFWPWAVHGPFDCSEAELLSVVHKTTLFLSLLWFSDGPFGLLCPFSSGKAVELFPWKKDSLPGQEQYIEEFLLINSYTNLGVEKPSLLQKVILLDLYSCWCFFAAPHNSATSTQNYCSTACSKPSKPEGQQSMSCYWRRTCSPASPYL